MYIETECKDKFAHSCVHVWWQFPSVGLPNLADLQKPFHHLYYGTWNSFCATPKFKNGTRSFEMFSCRDRYQLASGEKSY